MGRKIAILGVPMDLGAGRRGVDMGPSAIRMTHLSARLEKMGVSVADRGDIDVPIPEEIQVGDTSRKYAGAIRSVCATLREAVRVNAEEGFLPVVLGGDHSIAMGSIAGIADHYRENKEKKIGVIWMDAHGDMNTPGTTGSGNIHGMPLSYLLGLWDMEEPPVPRVHVESANACIVGARDLDEREKAIMKESGVHVFTMKQIDRRGISDVMEEAIRLASNGTVGIHVSFDIDVVDPAVAPGVGTPKRGGLNYREAHLSMELVADSGLLIGMDMVEVNPILDTKNVTAELASELILSGLGKRIF